MDRLLGMEVFVKIIEYGSFTRAAAALGISTPMVSTHIAQLENHLGVRLLNRTTRRMDLTQDGQIYFAQCQRILAEIEETESSLSKNSSLPRGRIRVDVPLTICEYLITPIIPEFRRLYPDIVLEIGISSHAHSITDANCDVALRHPLDETPSASLVSRPIGFSHLIMVASPEYLARRGEPKTPDDLKHHDCINVLDMRSGRITDWSFERHGTLTWRPIPGVLAVSHGGPRKEFAMQGLGITQVLSLQVSSELRDGKLKRVLRPWEQLTDELQVMYQKNRYMTAKVRAFIDFLVDKYPAGKEIEPPLVATTPSGPAGR